MLTYVFSVEELVSKDTQTILMENTTIERALDDLYGRGLPKFKILSMYSEPTLNQHVNGNTDDIPEDTSSI